ncbi:MAG TPA: S-layer homology domain-containing protein [Bacilli bacterium]|nr:S-layer homology domain-containing protein [Bacilli bacterium]
MKKKLTFVAALTLATVVGGSTAMATMPAKPGLEINQTLKGHFKLAMKFKDVANTGSEWALRYITELSAKGVINGYGNGEFRPSANVTQEEAIKMVVSALGLSDEATAMAEASGSLDLEVQNAAQVSNWAKPYVAVAVDAGFLDADTELNPRAKADREWVTELIVRALGFDAEAKAHMADTLTFQDAGEVDAEAVGYVAVAVDKGIINGYPDRTFQPHKPVKRSELAKILCTAESNFEYDSDYQAHAQGQLRGELKATTDGQLTFTTRTGAEMSYEFADQYYVFVGEKIATLADLEAGMPVRVLLNEQGEIVFLQALARTETREQAEMHAHGTVLSYTAPQATEDGSITILQAGSRVHDVTEMKRQDKLTLDVAPTVDVSLNTTTEAASSVKAGDHVQLDIVNDTVIGIDVLPQLTDADPIDFTE